MGRLTANFSECHTAALEDVAGLMKALRRAIAAAGATAIQSAEERFTPDGFAAALVTRESRASLRTFPAQATCFVEFRGEDGCDAESFARELGAYLRTTSREPQASVAIQRAAIRRPSAARSVPRGA